MKILFINSLYSPHTGGGAEVIFKSLVERVGRLGHDVMVLTTGDAMHGDVREIVDNVVVERISLFNIYWHYRCGKKSALKKALWHLVDVFNPVMMVKVYRKIVMYRPDVINIHNIQGLSSSVWVASKLAGVPVVQVLHDQYAICPNINRYRDGRLCGKRCFKCRIYRLPHKYISLLVDCVVGVSRYIVAAHDEYGLFDKARKCVVYNSRNLSAADGDGQRNAVKVFGYIGGMVESKGVEVLIREFAMISGDRYQLLIAGTGEDGYVERIKSVIRSCGVNAELVGYVDPAAFYQGIDVLVVPSLWNDTYPTVIIEALTNGVPVLGSSRGGIPEMIDDSECGRVFDPDEGGALAAMVSDLLTGRMKMHVSKDKLAYLRHRYTDEDKWAIQYVDLFERTIAENSLRHNDGGCAKKQHACQNPGNRCGLIAQKVEPDQEI